MKILTFVTQSQPALTNLRNNQEGGHCDLRFCSFSYFLDRFFGFCAKKLRFFGFGVHCGLRIFRIKYLVFGFREKY